MSKVPLFETAEENFPPLSFGAAIPSMLRALIAALAHRDGASVSQWLEPILHAAVYERLPEDIQRLMTFSSRLNLPYTAEAMREFIESAAASAAQGARPLDAAGVPKRHRHALWSPDGDFPKAGREPPEKKFWHDRLAAMGHERRLARVTPTHVRAVEALQTAAPNMREATEFVLGQLALMARSRNRHLALPPLLLVGPPAAGKTWWAGQLARALGVHHEFVAMPSVSGAFELCGASASWSSAQPGRILRTFLSTLDASPVFILDEIDKMNVGNYAPEPVLLGLIERATASRFRDEFFDRDFDVSRAIFIATANDPGRMDPALRSRFREIHVEAPKRWEREPLIASIWRTFRAQHAALRLPVELDARVMAVLVDRFQNARETQRLLEQGLGHAARRDGPLRVLPSDVGESATASIPSVALEGAFRLQ